MQKHWIIRAASVFIANSLFLATPTFADESIDIAAFLFFDRCFPKHNFCMRISDQFPNISVSLTKKSETDGFTLLYGTSSRTQNAFDHTYTQSASIEKIEPKDGSRTRYKISIVVIDENGLEVIHPYTVSVTPQIDDLKSSITTGVIFPQPEWDSVVHPKFYLGQKFTQSNNLNFDTYANH